MIIGIAAGIIALFILFGGPKNDALYDNMGKYAKKIVLDDDRLDLITEDLEAIKKIGKAYKAETKAFTKELETLYLEQNTKPASFDELFERVTAYEDQIDQQYYSLRVNVQSNLTDNEWKDILALAQKDIDKTKKANEKQLAKLKEGYSAAKGNILKSFKDDQKKEQASEHLDGFLATANRISEDLVMVYHKNEDVFYDRSSTKEDMLGVSEDYAADWNILLDAYTELHQQLAQLATEKEWGPIAKQLVKI